MHRNPFLRCQSLGSRMRASASALVPELDESEPVRADLLGEDPVRHDRDRVAPRPERPSEPDHRVDVAGAPDRGQENAQGHT